MMREPPRVVGLVLGGSPWRDPLPRPLPPRLPPLPLPRGGLGRPRITGR